MNKEQLMTVLKGSHVTEKTVGHLVFWVCPRANKVDIRRAVEHMFDGVVVDSVRTSTVKGKRVRFGRIQGKRVNRKKAYIRLADGHEINLMND